MSRIRLFAAGIATLGALAASFASAGSGALDTSFGTGGRTFTNVAGNATYGATSIAIQADGKVVVAANQFLVLRYNADGSLDTSFNGTGTVVTAVGAAFAVAIQPDGKIVVAGPGAGYGVLRFNSDGTPDSGFGMNGSASIAVGGGGSPYEVKIQGDGKIVMAGVAYLPDFKVGFGIARLNADGSADMTFNGLGSRVVAIGTEGAVARALALQADGKIVAAGYSLAASSSQASFALLRLMADGTHDATFGSGGVALTSFPVPGSGGSAAYYAQLWSVAIQADGKIAAGGTVVGIASPGHRTPVVARYTAAGVLDTAFNGSGFAITPFNEPIDYRYTAGHAMAIAAQSDGRLVVAASHGQAGGTDCAFARYLAGGTLDTSFNGTGTRTEALAGYCQLPAVAVQPDGKLVSGGLGGRKELVLFRHLSTGVPDSGFGEGGRVRSEVAFQPDVANAVGLQPDGRIVTLGGYPGLGTAQYETRHTTGGVLDPSFGTGGVAGQARSPSMLANAMAIDAAGRIFTAGSYYTPCAGHTCIGPTTLLVGRLTPDGALDSSFGSGGWATSASGLQGNSIARAIALQPDGKIVAAGTTDDSFIFNPRPSHFAVVRFTAAGASDTSFNGSGAVVNTFGGQSAALALALHPDGRIVATGHTKTGEQYDVVVLRYTAAGAIESQGVWDIGSSTLDAGGAVIVQPDGRILVAGSMDPNGFIARFADPATYDASFGDGGKRIVAGVVVALALQPDGKILALTNTFHVLRFLPSGAADTTFGIGGRLAIPMPAGALASALALQPDGRIVVAGSADAGTGSSDFALARLDPAAAAPMGASPERIDFGGQSMNTTSPARTVTITNLSGSSLTLQSVSVAPGDPYAVTAHDCTTLAALATCSVSLTFTPRGAGFAPGVLTLTGASAAIAVSLDGTGERSLVQHYYQSILRRAPDASGRAFWEAEAARVLALGANVNETWFAMAQQFYGSAEYAAFNRDDAA